MVGELCHLTVGKDAFPLLSGRVCGGGRAERGGLNDDASVFTSSRPDSFISEDVTAFAGPQAALASLGVPPGGARPTDPLLNLHFNAPPVSRDPRRAGDSNEFWGESM